MQGYVEVWQWSYWSKDPVRQKMGTEISYALTISCGMSKSCHTPKNHGTENLKTYHSAILAVTNTKHLNDNAQLMPLFHTVRSTKHPDWEIVPYYVPYLFIEKARVFEHKVEFLLKYGNKMSLEFFSCSESAILKRNMYMGLPSKQQVSTKVTFFFWIWNEDAFRRRILYITTNGKFSIAF